MCAGDITCFSTIPPETKAQAQFLAKADGIIAGIDLAEMIFGEVDPELQASRMWLPQTCLGCHRCPCIFQKIVNLQSVPLNLP